MRIRRTAVPHPETSGRLRPLCGTSDLRWSCGRGEGRIQMKRYWQSFIRLPCRARNKHAELVTEAV